jgi:protein SCO1
LIFAAYRHKCERVMNRRSFSPRAILCASLLLLGACSPAAAPVAEPPLQGARIGGPFSLVDSAGRAVTDRNFAGRYQLIYFGYSFCPDVCPVDLNYLMLGLKQFERQDAARAARVQPIFVSVDPERDTPPVLAAFVPQFHPRLIGLTGSSEQVRAAADAWLVQYSKQPGSAPDAYLVAHSNIAYLMGPQGEPLAIIPVDDIRTDGVNEGSPDLVAAELAKWVQ